MKSEKRLRRPILYIFFSDPNIFSSQFSRSLSRSSFSCARLCLVHATAHADADDLSTPAVDLKTGSRLRRQALAMRRFKN